MTPARPVLGAAFACGAAAAVAQEVTIRIAHLNPEDPFESHSGAMGAVFKWLVERSSNARSPWSSIRTASWARIPT